MQTYVLTQRGHFMELCSLLYRLKSKIGQRVIKDLYLLLYIIRNIAAFSKITCFCKKPAHSLGLRLFPWSCMFLNLQIWGIYNVIPVKSITIFDSIAIYDLSVLDSTDNK